MRRNVNSKTLYYNIFNAEYNFKEIFAITASTFQSLQTMKETQHPMNNESRAGRRQRGARNEVRQWWASRLRLSAFIRETQLESEE